MNIITQLPQYILGLAIVHLTGAKLHRYYRGKRIYITDKKIGVSFGEIIIMYERLPYRTMLHEYGHSLQSEKWKWLYLPVIGLPSVAMNLISRISKKYAEDYYNRWPEDDADRLGGVVR